MEESNCYLAHTQGFQYVILFHPSHFFLSSTAQYIKPFVRLAHPYTNSNLIPDNRL